jgi:MHS family alpha-ketoglutarate permease-like MFS transporter
LAQLLQNPSQAAPSALHKNNEKVSLMDNASTLPRGGRRARRGKTTASRLKSIFSGSIGNMVEWYDWYVYAAFSLYFAKAFFPAGDTTAQLLNTAAIFAVGFLMRPIGGWLMGLYADRKGRKAALMASVLLMCFGSLVIALTRATKPSASPRRSCWCSPACCRACRWAANTAPRPPT